MKHPTDHRGDQPGLLVAAKEAQGGVAGAGGLEEVAGELQQLR